ncbi:MAG: hypothetical protein A3C06_01930 [Candidatus Taylorbacteria bacterium RIFCSPHIGHO2_02_FULL_46_13]|uniref:Polymerase beta nucleotidyltransferase domain-containing protein n=1 Tax=Candidatus Taylorbacteria bacterium RIFCSPHIGHO2_02_FULL_46_13 TaxID=1802312 RepID=A0A1G2MQ27_9BACT|nr:MAG: hypothetical protein A3C06_01930 [Candidatus Taylorbacteria bacterium RIFCSPHIGHO2_02_FULL_46_13]
MFAEEMKLKIAEIAEKHGLDLVVLFGSSARGTHRAGSDIDIAVFSKHLADISLVAEEIASAIGRNDVEVADLSHASSYLMRAVAEDGIVLFESQNDFFEEWKIYARNVWFDTARLRARQKHALKSWARNYETKNA